MSIEDTKAKIAVMQAFVSGKTIECESRISRDGWDEVDPPSWDWVNFDYRVAPPIRQVRRGAAMSDGNNYVFPFNVKDADNFGLAKREHAAIALRVPMSGDDEIDAMIRAANRKDFAAMAMNGVLSNPLMVENISELASREKMTSIGYLASTCSGYADALLAELERTK